MARLPRCCLPDGIFHVTTRGVDGCWIYRDDGDRLVFLYLLSLAAERFRWTVHALCLMGNHYHLVLECKVKDLSDGFRLLNGRYAQGFNEKYGRRGHLFGDRFCSRVIADEAYLSAACDYVVQNPVRAGLVESAEDWRWSASRYDPELSLAIPSPAPARGPANSVPSARGCSSWRDAGTPPGRPQRSPDRRPTPSAPAPAELGRTRTRAPTGAGPARSSRTDARSRPRPTGRRRGTRCRGPRPARAGGGRGSCARRPRPRRRAPPRRSRREPCSSSAASPRARRAGREAR